MTGRPKLYPGHQHSWTDAEPELFTNSLVRCTVCGLQMPRNAAGLDGLRDEPEPFCEAHDWYFDADGTPATWRCRNCPATASVTAQPDQETRPDA